MNVLRKTWLVTSLFVVVSFVVWWRLAGLSVAKSLILPTLLLTPTVWWFVVGRYERPHLLRGILGGALAGLATQSAPDVPEIIRIYLHRGTGDGEAQLIALASLTIYLFIGLVATATGALVGFVVVLLQRRWRA